MSDVKSDARSTKGDAAYAAPGGVGNTAPSSIPSTPQAPPPSAPSTPAQAPPATPSATSAPQQPKLAAAQSSQYRETQASVAVHIVPAPSDTVKGSVFVPKHPDTNDRKRESPPGSSTSPVPTQVKVKEPNPDVR